MKPVFTLSLVLLLLVNGIVNVYAQQDIPSPFKQFTSGISLENIVCKSGYLLLSSPSGYPACVKSETMTKLVLHGWTFIKSKSISPIGIVNMSKIMNNTANNTTTLVNTTTVTNSIKIPNNNNVINASYIFKLYQDSYVNGTVPQLAQGNMPYPLLPVNFTESSTEPNSIKVLFVGMSPNPLKVGDIPLFSLNMAEHI